MDTWGTEREKLHVKPWTEKYAAKLLEDEEGGGAIFIEEYDVVGVVELIFCLFKS